MGISSGRQLMMVEEQMIGKIIIFWDFVMSCNGNHITNLWSRNKAVAVAELIKGDN